MTGTERKVNTSSLSSVENLADDLTRNRTVSAVVQIEKELADGQIGGMGRLDAHAPQLTIEKLIGQLSEHTGAVAGLAVVGHSAAMCVVAERLQRHLEHAMVAPPIDMGHKADAAGVVLEARIVEAMLCEFGERGASLFARRLGTWHSSIHHPLDPSWKNITRKLMLLSYIVSTGWRNGV